METKTTKTMPPRVRPCTAGCGVLTRSSKMTLVQAPGTMVRQGGGKCPRCYPPGSARRTAGPADVDTNRAGLESYFANRRRRGVPAEGLRLA